MLKSRVQKTELTRLGSVVDGCSALFESCGEMRLGKQTSTRNEDNFTYTLHVRKCMGVKTNTKDSL